MNLFTEKNGPFLRKPMHYMFVLLLIQFYRRFALDFQPVRLRENSNSNIVKLDKIDENDDILESDISTAVFVVIM